MSRRKLIVLIAALALGYAFFATGGEASLQVAAQGRLSRAAQSVGQFHAAHQRFPTALSEVLAQPEAAERLGMVSSSSHSRGSGRKVYDLEWLQYRAADNGTFTLWATRDEWAGAPGNQPRDISPTGTDLWCSFASNGDRLKCSQYWYW